jgi:hypothetical protein
MFARKVSARLKPNSLPGFTHLIESEILPWLRQQGGFLDLIILAAADGIEVATISFWDHSCSANAASAICYSQAMKILGTLLDGVPSVKTFDVLSSTLQKPEPGYEPEQQSLPADEPSGAPAYDTRA